ncbi:unnamed protein product [Rhizophagus irregularis]|nr:unnamed protein product [Rhizophagus irregularis]
MTRTLYNNRISWAKAYMPFQSLNSTSTLCEVEEAINKRYEEEIRYCQLTDLKAKYTTVGLPHLSSQFFSDVDTVIVEFLTPLILSLQCFQISQSFTYEGQLISCSFDNSPSDTPDDNFVEDIVDEPQHFQGSYNNEIIQQIIPKRNKFGVAFSTAKTAINIALETRCDNELVKLLRDFISTKQRSRNAVDLENNMKGAPCKKRMKSSIEVMGRKKVMHETSNHVNVQETDDSGGTSKSQRKCLLCKKPGHYQKKCPSIRE